MNILFFSRRFYPDIGGVERHVFEVGRRLVKKGHKVTVITESTEKPTQKELIDRICDINKIEGINVYRIYSGADDWFKKFRIWRSLWQLRNLIKATDIIHCHDVFFWYLPFRFLYPKKPVFTTFHGYESYPIKRKSIIIRKISEKLSWGNICIGDFIQKWYGTKPTYVSYGAVDSSSLRGGTTKQSHIRLPRSVYPEQGRRARNDNKLSAVFIGRLDEQTGILEYVKAIEILKNTYPEFTFTVVGDGKYRRLIEKKVKVLGFQKNPEKYLQKYHFIFVSRYLSILEAFAAKKLVFALYDNPIKEDYLKMTPFAKFIITAKDPSELARNVQFFLHNTDLEEKIINKSYRWVKNQTWKKMTDMYLTLWKKV